MQETEQTRKTILELLRKIDREGMPELIAFLEQSDYFEAPASTRFHGNYKGGLALHSLNVYDLFRQKDLDFDLGLDKELVILCSLLHDLCKVELYHKKLLRNGEPAITPYTSEETLPLGHSTKSIFLINKFIHLGTEEALIIRWHMSWSDYEFKKHIDAVKKIEPAIMAFITSDIEASSYLD